MKHFSTASVSSELDGRQSNGERFIRRKCTFPESPNMLFGEPRSNTVELKAMFCVPSHRTATGSDPEGGQLGVYGGRRVQILIT